MRILVCGGAGFIGRNMVERFAQAGHTVHATCHDSIPDYDKAYWHNVDLCDRQAVTDIIEATTPDIVIQAAATTSGAKDIVNTPAMHVTDNAVMNSYIFRAATEAKVKHVVFFSCTVMYPDGECTEETPPAPNAKYFGVAHTKLYLEKMCEFYAGLGDTIFTAIRHSNIYGPYDKYDLEHSHMFGATMRKVMDASETVTIWGSGEERRDVLYVGDLCDFVEAALERQESAFGLYNCGYGISLPVVDIAQKIIAASGKEMNIEHDLTAPTIPTSLTLNCDKARADLGWWPNTTLDDGIAKTMAWYRNEFL